MTLSQRIAQLTGPDRAGDALDRLEKQARSDRQWWSILALLCIVLSWFVEDYRSYAALICAAVFIVGSGIARLFALLSAAMMARGL